MGFFGEKCHGIVKVESINQRLGCGCNRRRFRNGSGDRAPLRRRGRKKVALLDVNNAALEKVNEEMRDAGYDSKAWCS